MCCSWSTRNGSALPSPPAGARYSMRARSPLVVPLQMRLARVLIDAKKPAEVPALVAAYRDACARHHRSAEDRGCAVIEEEAHAHELHAVILRRDELLVGADGRALLDAHHQRNARPIDVAVEQTDALAEMLERAGEVH